ncbi:MAG: ABC transporter permease subunit, partial [Ilumatobacteraceae bacterium]
NMIGSMIASQFSQAQNWPLGSAMAVLMIGAVLLALVVGVAVVWVVPRLFGLLAPISEQFRRTMHARRTARAIAGTTRHSMSVDLNRLLLAVWTGLVLLFLFIPIALVFRHSFNGGSSFSIWSGETSTKWWGELFDGGATRAVLLRFVVITALALILKKIFARTTDIASRRLNWVGPGGFVVALVVNGLISDWFRKIFDFAGIGDAIRNSFMAAFGATIIAVVLGGLSGVALARRPGKWTKIFMTTVFLILVTPEVMDAIALVTWFQRLQDVPILGYVFKNGLGPFNGGMHKLWVGQSLYASAVVTLIVRARLSGLDESLEEAAADLGAPPARAFRQITLPLISSALIAGGLLSFTLCLDNAVISTLVSEAGSTTFPVALLGATKSTIKPFWGVGAVMLFMITMAALAFVAVVLRRSGESSSDIAATLAGG